MLMLLIGAALIGLAFTGAEPLRRSQLYLPLVAERPKERALAAEIAGHKTACAIGYVVLVEDVVDVDIELRTVERRRQIFAVVDDRGVVVRIVRLSERVCRRFRLALVANTRAQPQSSERTSIERIQSP